MCRRVMNHMFKTNDQKVPERLILMKHCTPLLGPLVAIALALSANVPSNAQTLDTILDLETSSGGPLSSDVGRAILVDPFSTANSLPDLLVAGQIPDLADDNGTPYKLFRLTQSEPPNPSNPVLMRLHASGATVHSMTSDSLGNLYWAGGLNSPEGNKWIVRRSFDGGATWQELQRWSLAARSFAEARGLVVDDSGRLFACGMALDAKGVSHWIIQRSEDGGLSWTTIDVFKGSGTASVLTGNNIVTGLGIASVPGPSGALFAVGTRGSRYSGAWTTLRSIDNGGTWQVVDSWVPSGTSRARKIATDGSRIFVLGDTGGRTEHDPSPWVVRMSADGGSTWQTVFGPWSYGPCVYPRDFTVGAYGDLWIAGAVHKEYGTGKKRTFTSIATLVRLQKSQPGSWVWTEIPISPEAQGTYRAEASAITADELGQVYVNSSFKATDASPWRWVVQRCWP